MKDNNKKAAVDDKLENTSETICGGLPDLPMRIHEAKARQSW